MPVLPPLTPLPALLVPRPFPVPSAAVPLAAAVPPFLTQPGAPLAAATASLSFRLGVVPIAGVLPAGVLFGPNAPGGRSPTRRQMMGRRGR